MPWFQIGVAAVFLAALIYGKSSYDEKRRAEGRAELLPQIEADKRAFEDITGYMQAITANSNRLKERLAAAEKRNGQRQVVERERIQYIERVEPTGETECLRTTDAIDKVLRK